MSNRIDKKFKQLRQQKKKAFIAFLTAGDPSLKTTEDLVTAFEHSGVDIVELGVPFSDPLADGPTIQASYQRSLAKGTTLTKILATVERIRRQSQIPIALMSSYNPIFHYGEEKFTLQAKRSGVDGVIIPDLPPEEAGVLIKAARKNQLSTIFLAAPTTTKQRMKIVTNAATGFVYYVSLTGVTGARKELSLDIVRNVRMAKSFTHKPVCVGFGISTPAQVRSVGRIADGVIVGSAIVKEIMNNTGRKDLVQKTAKFAGRLAKGLS